MSDAKDKLKAALAKMRETPEGQARILQIGHALIGQHVDQLERDGDLPGWVQLEDPLKKLSIRVLVRTPMPQGWSSHSGAPGLSEPMSVSRITCSAGVAETCVLTHLWLGTEQVLCGDVDCFVFRPELRLPLGTLAPGDPVQLVFRGKLESEGRIE